MRSLQQALPWVAEIRGWPDVKPLELSEWRLAQQFRARWPSQGHAGDFARIPCCLRHQNPLHSAETHNETRDSNRVKHQLHTPLGIPKPSGEVKYLASRRRSIRGRVAIERELQFRRNFSRLCLFIP